MRIKRGKTLFIYCSVEKNIIKNKILIYKIQDEEEGGLRGEVLIIK